MSRACGVKRKRVSGLVSVPNPELVPASETSTSSVSIVSTVVSMPDTKNRLSQGIAEMEKLLTSSLSASTVVEYKVIIYLSICLTVLKQHLATDGP